MTGLTLVALVASGAFLRLWNVGTSRLNYDESFTAMAGRRSFSQLVSYLSANDSHPPLDYLLHAPLARAGVDEFWFRFPSVVFSVAAIALLAWWLRDRPIVAIVATALMAFAPFQLIHGREARMYAELEFLGVAIAFVADRWVHHPRTRHSVMLGGLVAAGFFTHVSMFLLAAGLLALAGRRRDRAAWEWRGAIGVALLAWIVAWAPVFLVQARGGHSSWIPHTTPSTLVHALGSAISSPIAILVVAATIAGITLLVRRRDPLGRVTVCLYAIPVALGAIAGLAVPVVIDRTFTLIAWVPALAIGVLIDTVATRERAAAAGIALAGLAVVATGVPAVVTGHTGPDTPLRVVGAHLRTGDIVAVRPASKAPELQWSLGVRRFPDSEPVTLHGRHSTYALRVGDGRPTGRIWLIDWHRFGRPRSWGNESCHRTVAWRATSVRCIESDPLPRTLLAASTAPATGRTPG